MPNKYVSLGLRLVTEDPRRRPKLPQLGEAVV